jgi:hypothetical protein
MYFANLGEESQVLLDDAQFELFDSLSLIVGPITAVRRWYSTEWLSSSLGWDGNRLPSLFYERGALSVLNTDGHQDITLEGWTPNAALSFRAHHGTSSALQIYCSQSISSGCTATATVEGSSANDGETMQVATSLCCSFQPDIAIPSILGNIEAIHGGAEWRPFRPWPEFQPIRFGGQLNFEHMQMTFKTAGSDADPATLSMLFTAGPLGQISPFLSRFVTSTNGLNLNAGVHLDLSNSCSVSAKVGSDNRVGKILATVQLAPSLSVGVSSQLEMGRGSEGLSNGAHFGVFGVHVSAGE